MRKAVVPIALAAGLAWGACSDAPDVRQKVLESWGQDLILPTYRDFEGKAAALDRAVDAFCGAPASEGLDAAREAWSEARAPWKRMEVLAFGPYKIEPWRLGPRLDSWPVRTVLIDDLLAKDVAITADGIGTFHKGFPGIEYLLFQPELDLVAEFESTPRRCDYLQVMSGDLAAAATEMRDAWDPEGENYVSELIDAGGKSEMFESVHMAVSEIVNRMAFTVENARRDKLGRPIGETSGGVPAPDKAESQFSARSVQDILDTLDGIEAFYFGPADNEDALGLDDYVRDRGLDFAQSMRDELAASRAALNAIPGPLTEAVETDNELVQAASEELADLQRLIQVDILNALSLTPSFNDNDGD